VKYIFWVRLFLLLALLFSLISCKQTASNVSQPKSINDILQPLINEKNIPAMAAVVISNDKIIAEGVVGVRKWGDETPVTLDDQFHIGYCGKAMTATLIAMLVEQGKLSWTTTLSEIYPEMANEMLPRYQNVTLLHLLSHHAGLPGNDKPYPLPAEIVETDWYKLTEPIKQQRYEYTKAYLCRSPEEVASLPEPGTVFLYSNEGFVIAGAIAEYVAGKSWEELITTLLFQPLGLTTAGFGSMGTDNQVDQPWQHLCSDDKITPIPPDSIRIDIPPVMGPCGRIHMSIRDWAKFIIQHLEGEKGGSNLLKPETFKVLHTPPFDTGEYALGWFVEMEGTVFTHYGSNGVNYAYVWMSTEYDFAVLVTTNIDSPVARTASREAINTLVSKFLTEE